MAESYTKRNEDGTRSVYYPDAQKNIKKNIGKKPNNTKCSFPFQMMTNQLFHF